MRRDLGGGRRIPALRSLGLMARVLAVAGVTIAVLAVGFVLALRAVHRSRAATAADARTEQVLTLSAQLERLAVDLETGERGFVITHADVFLAPYVAARAVIPTTERRLAGLVRGHPAERATVVQIESRIGVYVHGWAAPVIATARRSPAAAAALERTGRGKRQMDAIRGRFATLDHTETGLAAAARARAHQASDRVVLLAVLALVVVLALLGGGVAFALRLVVVPARRLGRVVGRLAEGELSARAPERSGGELGRLEHALNRMAATLESGEADLRRHGGELSEALQAASSQAALHRAVLDNAHDAFIAVDDEGAIIEFNPSAEDLLGWARADVLGRPLIDTVVPPASRELITASLARHRETGEAPILGRAIETEAAHRDGRRVPVEMTVTAVQLGERPRFNAFLRDITERRERELERELRLAVSSVLAESATLQEAIAGVLPALGERLSWQLGGYWGLDEAAETLRCEAWWRAPDIEADELERLSRDLVLPLGRGLPGEVARSGEARWIVQDEAPHERRFPRARAGWEAGVHAGVGVPVTADDRVIGVLEFFGCESRRPDRVLLDALAAVSAQLGQYVERKRLEHEAERLKDEFFALVSHELRTPLTSIVGYCEILLDEDDEDEAGLAPQQRRFLETVDRSAHRLLRLVGDLLFVAQIEAGTVHLELGDVDLAQVAADAVQAAHPTAEARGVSLRLHADVPTPIRGDRDRLGQATDNLVANAVKFTPGGGTVSVVLTPGDGEATLEVSDTGIGIPAEEQARLFDRFFRASTATDRAIPGVGLGLAIVKAIAEAHAGEISVSSVEGRGTTFALTVPLGDHASGGEAAAASGGGRAAAPEPASAGAPR